MKMKELQPINQHVLLEVEATEADRHLSEDLACGHARADLHPPVREGRRFPAADSRHVHGIVARAAGAVRVEVDGRHTRHEGRAADANRDFDVHLGDAALTE